MTKMTALLLAAAMALTDLSVSIDDAALAAEPKLAIVLGTATFNCIFVEVLATPLKKVLKR